MVDYFFFVQEFETQIWFDQKPKCIFKFKDNRFLFVSLDLVFHFARIRSVTIQRFSRWLVSLFISFCSNTILSDFVFFFNFFPLVLNKQRIILKHTYLCIRNFFDSSQEIYSIKSLNVIQKCLKLFWFFSLFLLFFSCWVLLLQWNIQLISNWLRIVQHKNFA